VSSLFFKTRKKSSVTNTKDICGKECTKAVSNVAGFFTKFSLLSAMWLNFAYSTWDDPQFDNIKKLKRKPQFL
jgi:hypothetical protein